MEKQKVFSLIFISGAILLSGCVVRTYELTKDRVDQNLNLGNRGYLAGQTPEGVVGPERKTTRTTQVVEVELNSPIKFVKGPGKVIETIKPAEEPENRTDDNQIWGNQGYLTRNAESTSETITQEEAAAKLTKYTVQKNDTLQKISQKFYGTTKMWAKVFDANKEILRTPNKIRPGQILNIPEIPSAAGITKTAPGNKFKILKEPSDNLK